MPRQSLTGCGRGLGGSGRGLGRWVWLPSVGISQSCGGGFGGVCATGGASCVGSGLASGGICSGGMGGGEGVLPRPAGDDVGFTSHMHRSSGEDNLVPPAAKITV